MGDALSTIQGRALGEELRMRREARKLTGSYLAHILGWDPSKVSRMESGKTRYRLQDVVAYLAVCRVTGADRDRLLYLAAHANEPDLLQRASDEEELRTRTYLRYEWDALRIVSYQPLLIPGLLQTPGYMREAARAWDVAEEKIEQLVEAKRKRQHVLRGEFPTPGVFFIHEHALRCSFEDPAIMRDQLLHLIFKATRPHITVRVVPAALGLKAPVNSFVLMDLPEKRAVVFLEAALTSVFLEQKKDIEIFRRHWKRLEKLALDEAESRVFLAGLANGPTSPERTPDDLPDHFLAEE
ncbi:helix-turn-helix domain-containing protein [Goodfellowiella coeruleoviolacea]|uniref:Helix-turn-helix domain-containing protein n=1 Tax=Goodfellowiella coeruleoviolacea TaxID=334858 RepID=A0AAE3GC62_9PSEU|nr:helix-turn-helix transcriptional regulator [Goodfellowiella coeruleoviolacea]MCP2163468.1 Helix-turn-helix domain-containing protein [Goodfellowiella coeruleoviolacea]